MTSPQAPPAQSTPNRTASETGGRFCLSSVAFALWTILLKYNRVGPIAVFNFLIPVFGAVLSAVFLDETILEWKNVAALPLVGSGI